jgi:hypothetical protein
LSATWRRAGLWPLLPPLAALVLSLAIAIRAGTGATEGHLVYALDDAYIHMAMAKNLARGGTWGCTPFHFSSSSSSPLWTLAIGIVYLALGVRDWVPLVLNIAIAVAMLLVAHRWLERFGAPPILRAVALFGIVIALPLPAMVLMGMEHVLHALLTIAFAAASVHALGHPPGDTRAARRQTIALSVLAALLALSRYEGLFLVGFVCLAFAARRQVLRGFWIGAAGLLPVVSFGAFSVAHGGYFLPNSLVLKAAGEQLSMLRTLLKPFGRDDLASLASDRALPILLAVGLLAALAQWFARQRPWAPQVLLPLLLAPLIAAHCHFVFSPTFWVYRYDAYLVGFGVFAAAAALSDLRWPPAWPAGLLPAIAVGLLVVLVGDVREGLYPATEVEGMRNTYLEHYQAAQFLQVNYPDAVVVVNDLGAVTYYNRSRILDLVGLGDVEPLDITRRTGQYTSADVRAWTDRYHPRLAIVQLGWGWVVPRIPAEWVEVAEVDAPPHHHRIGFFAVDPDESWALRARVQEHYGLLGASLGYRVKLRRPPDRSAGALSASGPEGSARRRRRRRPTRAAGRPAGDREREAAVPRASSPPRPRPPRTGRAAGAAGSAESRTPSRGAGCPRRAARAGGPPAPQAG